MGIQFWGPLTNDKEGVMKFIMFPLLAVLMIVYAVLAWLSGDTGMAARLDSTILEINLISGAVWAVSMSTLLIVVGLFLLFIELLKATKIDSASMVNNGLSMLIFVVAMILFIVVESYGTSTFFIITMMTFLDAVAGYTITAVTARRDIGFG
jgi:hypothetical protein